MYDILQKLYEKIEIRTSSAQEVKPDWPCRKGCSLCCQKLAYPLIITETEWSYLSKGMAQLPPEVQQEVHQKIESLGTWDKTQQKHVVCPLLDQETGACRTYEYRPAACRMYGFYVSRHNNQWCEEIEVLYTSHQLDGVILGNFTATKEQLKRNFGEEKSIVEWYKSTKEAKHQGE